MNLTQRALQLQSEINSEIFKAPFIPRQVKELISSMGKLLADMAAEIELIERSDNDGN